MVLAFADPNVFVVRRSSTPRILKDIEESSGGSARLSAGTLYGLLKRLLDQIDPSYRQ